MKVAVNDPELELSGLGWMFEPVKEWYQVNPKDKVATLNFEYSMINSFNPAGKGVNPVYLNTEKAKSMYRKKAEAEDIIAKYAKLDEMSALYNEAQEIYDKWLKKLGLTQETIRLCEQEVDEKRSEGYEREAAEKTFYDFLAIGGRLQEDDGINEARDTACKYIKSIERLNPSAKERIVMYVDKVADSYMLYVENGKDAGVMFV